MALWLKARREGKVEILVRKPLPEEEECVCVKTRERWHFRTAERTCHVAGEAFINNQNSNHHHPFSWQEKATAVRLSCVQKFASCCRAPTYYTSYFRTLTVIITLQERERKM